MAGTSEEMTLDDMSLDDMPITGGAQDLTAFQRDILFSLAGMDEPNGLQLKGVLEEYYGEEVHHGRIYPNLDDLVTKGLIAKGELNRRTNTYALTNRGRREVIARHTWERKQLESTLEKADETV